MDFSEDTLLNVLLAHSGRGKGFFARHASSLSCNKSRASHSIAIPILLHMFNANGTKSNGGREARCSPVEVSSIGFPSDAI